MVAQLIKLQVAPDLVDQVYQALLDAISGGILAPGVRITQDELAARFSVSRQPVLQALRLLKQDGLVQDAPGRGLLVAPLEPRAIAHLYQVRGALDALAARLAAERGAVLSAGLIERGREASRGHSVAAMIDADIAFHRAIYAASGNPLIERSAQPHWVQLKRVMGAVLQSSRQREPLWDEHERIAEAIRQRDAPRAAALIEHHGTQASSNLQQRLHAMLAAAAIHPTDSDSHNDNDDKGVLQ
ncbi:MAG: GntR family transcriptional regulator [Burkholderiaceae bacterium]